MLCDMGSLNLLIVLNFQIRLLPTVWLVLPKVNKKFCWRIQKERKTHWRLNKQCRNISCTEVYLRRWNWNPLLLLVADWIDVIKYFSCYGNGISKEDICFLAQFAFKTKLIPFMKWIRLWICGGSPKSLKFHMICALKFKSF